MQATEQGVQIVFDALTSLPGNLTTLTGGTLSMVVQSTVTGARGGPYPCVVGPTATVNGIAYTAGAYGYYMTLGTEFIVGGGYYVQFIASFNSGAQVYKAPPYYLTVGTSL